MSNVRKFVVAIVAAIGAAITLGVAPEEWGDYLAIAIVFLGGIGVYVVPNDPA